MEGIREVALAHYEILPIEEKAKIERDFKWSVEHGSVSEYFKSLNDELRPELADACLEACKGYKGILDFNAFISLKYMVTSLNILKCEGCSTLILGRPFFSCYECLLSGKDSYDLCCGCYISKKFKDHNHQQFYDNYSLHRLGWMKFAEMKRDRDSRQAFLEGFFLKAANSFVEMAEDFKTQEWTDGEEDYDFDQKKDLAEISRRLNNVERMLDENEDSENAITGLKPKLRSYEDEDEMKPIGFRPGDIMGAEPSFPMQYN